MRTSKLLLSSVASTSVMTLFSALISGRHRKEFNEALLLGKLLTRVTPLNPQQAKAAGWAGHYMVGLAFSGSYLWYLQQARKKATLANGTAFGAIGGVAGALGWALTLAIHPDPPAIDRKKFFPQLVLGHVVFGIVNAAALNPNTVKKA